MSPDEEGALERLCVALGADLARSSYLLEQTWGLTTEGRGVALARWRERLAPLLGQTPCSLDSLVGALDLPRLEAWLQARGWLRLRWLHPDMEKLDLRYRSPSGDEVLLDRRPETPAGARRLLLALARVSAEQGLPLRALLLQLSGEEAPGPAQAEGWHLVFEDGARCPVRLEAVELGRWQASILRGTTRYAARALPHEGPRGAVHALVQALWAESLAVYRVVPPAASYAAEAAASQALKTSQEPVAPAGA